MSPRAPPVPVAHAHARECPDGRVRPAADGRAGPFRFRKERRSSLVKTQSHVVDGALSTFGCVDWESDLCRGVMRARCYPFDMPKHRFHGFNPQVLVHTLQRHVHNVTYMYVSFQFGKYTYKHIVDMYIQCLGRVSINLVYTSKYLVYTC